MTRHIQQRKNNMDIGYGIGAGNVFVAGVDMCLSCRQLFELVASMLSPLYHLAFA